MKVRRLEDELAAPRPKRTNEIPGQPIPVPVASLTGQPSSNFFWKCFHGSLQRNEGGEDAEGRQYTVRVTSRTDIENIWTNGYYGHIVSLRNPSVPVYEIKKWEPGLDFVNGAEEQLVQQQQEKQEQQGQSDDWQEDPDFWQTSDNPVAQSSPSDNPESQSSPSNTNRCTTVEEPLCVSDASCENKSAECRAVNGKQVVNGKESSVHEDKLTEDDVDENKDEEAQGEGEKEEGPRCWAEVEERLGESQDELVLSLSLCEAFYLSYALGCLVVEEGGEELSLLQMWRKYSQLEPDFMFKYAVYHYLRTLGWVVRSGTYMGSDWTLYKLGPPFYHASFCVRVEVVCGRTGRILNTNTVTPLSWADILGLNRLNECINKELLVARVEVLSVLPTDFDSPHVLRNLAVTLRRVKRWQPGEMRWESKPAVPVQAKH